MDILPVSSVIHLEMLYESEFFSYIKTMCKTPLENIAHM